MTVPDAKPTVLMVEDRADVLHGHFPKLFAEFAEGFADAGCEIHVLTSLGWPRDRGDNRFVLHRYGVLAATIHRLSRACQELSHRLEHHRGLVGRHGGAACSSGLRYPWTSAVHGGWGTFGRVGG